MSESLFEQLPTKALSQIVEALENTSPSSVFNLLFIKASKAAAERVIYKSITLRGPHPTNRSPWSRTKCLIDRIVDSDDVVSSYIYELEIDNWSGPYFPEFDEAVLEKILRSLKALHSFSWKTERFIPKSVKAIFHARFPSARLCYTNTSRGRDANAGREYNMVMDLEILTSPQLHSLSYTFLKEDSGSSRSELPIMARIMTASKNLRILRFVCEPDRRFHFEDYYGFYERFGSDGHGSKNLPFSAFTLDDQLEPLEELAFSSDPLRAESFYDFSDSHCNAWRYCMDWSKLRTLDLGGQGPSPFFEIFRGYVPNLKSLSFTLTRGGLPNIGVENVRIIGNFLDSINGLEQLCVTNATNGFFPILWSHVKRHGPTLRTLKTSNVLNATWKWTEPALLELLQSCPELTELTVDVELGRGIQPNGEKESVWPKRSFSTLSQFTLLRTLHIAIVLDNPETSPGGLAAASTLATDSFVDFFRHNPLSRLRSLQLTATKAEYAPIQEIYYSIVVINVKRQERDDAPSPINGGFEVEAKRRDGRSGLWEKLMLEMRGG
ncbi:uncharacterized protein BP5553_07246 [Venustampulla echinocandica]|uniref:Uncharacterized protein n=1 Tax=Venustampulla echinocandica TaxID=2656787 RepID=A0A370TIY1_9HELO|nr:uncharacterized protein BP5553_07246 [Venustampulla echinocandica]RDL35315.1 hypothetical protein BP5553_07246 [Venustampulla echinocandica]